LAGPPGLKLTCNSHTKNSEVLKAEKSNDIKDKNICYVYELMVVRRAKSASIGLPLGFLPVGG
jgi:hypothetical protein